MHSFQALAEQFEKHFNKRQFPDQPSTLYDAAQYILQIGGKRVRPVAVLMGNELFGEIKEESFSAATRFKVFFTLANTNKIIANTTITPIIIQTVFLFIC